MNDFQEYLSLTQASQLSGWSVWKLKRLYDKGELNGTRSPRGDRVILRSALERLIEREADA